LLPGIAPKQLPRALNMPFETHLNPLLDAAALTRFDALRPEHVTPAVNHLLAAARATLAATAATTAAATWDNVVTPLEDATDRLARAWGAVSHLNAVLDSPALRAQYNDNLPRVTAFWTELAQDARLCARYRALSEGADFDRWSAVKKKVITNALRDFRLGGADLAPQERQRFSALREQLARASARFAENVLDSTQHFELLVDDVRALAGVPDDVLPMYRAAAQAEGKDGHRITLHAPSYLPIMQYAHDRALRERVYRAYVTRASEFGRPEWDNGALMVELLRDRQQLAALLGYRNYAQMSLVPKMAQEPGQVLEFLRELACRAKPHAEREMAELRDFAARELDLSDLQAWDVAYASERLREQRFDYSEQEARQYFSEDAVLAGLFRLSEILFSVRIRPDQAATWHPDVRFYRIEAPCGSLLGQFYLDLYTRSHKQGGAWHGNARGRRGNRGNRGNDATPVSFLTCNIAPPIGASDGPAVAASAAPARLTHREVITLFHEFGHGLHHLLTRVDEPAVAGMHGVEWDAVELPSQFLENFAWQWEVLQGMTARAADGAPLPRSLYDKMRAARNFQSGMQMVRQLEFALFDLQLHSEIDWSQPANANANTIQRLARAVQREVAVVIPPDEQRLGQSFTHIFSGGYAAGYYSYKWAEVLSADCYSAFDEGGAPLDAALGARFRDQILAVGGSRPALESFVAFRGRPPTIDALLCASGLDVTTGTSAIAASA